MDLALAAIAILVPILVLFARIVFVPNGITFDDLLRRTDLEWPHGVQEEEPTHWRFDRPSARSSR
jgi:hypothetical protein